MGFLWSSRDAARIEAHERAELIDGPEFLTITWPPSRVDRAYRN